MKGQPPRRGCQRRLNIQRRAVNIPVEIELPTGGPLPEMHLTFYTADDAQRRLVTANRLLLPWARLKAREESEGPRKLPPELAGGDARRGREVFASTEAQCSKCHLVRGQGGKIGPDLSNLMHRDYASVLRDVVSPGFAVNPDYISHAVTLKDGRQLQGTLRRMLDSPGVSVMISRSPCALTVPKQPRRPRVSLDRCTGCGDCVTRIHCPAISLTTDRKCAVDLDACVGCGLCAQVCPEGAIVPEPFGIAAR